MEELFSKLNKVPGCYFGFIAGVIAYVKKKPEHIKTVMDFLDTSETLTTSDIIEFIAKQPDFFDEDPRLKQNN